jgi:hypothetical protein
LTSVMSARTIAWLDDGRVRITTKEPDVTIPAKLSSDTMLTLATEVIERAGKFSIAETFGTFPGHSVAEYVKRQGPGFPRRGGATTVGAKP